MADLLLRDPVAAYAMIGVILLIATLFLGGVFVALQGAGQNRLKKRIQAIAAGGVVLKGGKGTGRAQAGSPGRKKQIQQKLKEIEEKGKRKKTVSIKDLIQQAGLAWSMKQFVLLCFATGLAGLGISAFMGWPPIAMLGFTATMGIGFPRWLVKFLAKRRMNKFLKSFADAIDVIVRGIRSGLPLGECLNIIGRELPDPIGLEFRLITEGMKLGMKLDETLDRMQQRVPLADVKFFGIVLLIQQQTGGNLADTLSKLSDVLRGRKKMKDKVQALSQEAKSSASIIGSLPFLMTLLLYLVNKAYILILFNDSIGHFLIIGGLTWMSIGVLVMRQMINFEM